MENLILQSVEELKYTPYKTYIWGAQLTAEHLAEWYKKNGVKIEGFLISAKFYRQGVFVCGKEAGCLEEFLKSTKEKVNIVLGRGSLTKREALALDYTNINKFFIFDSHTAFLLESEELNIWDDDFWSQNENKLCEIREAFEDEISRENFDQFAYQKRTSTYWKEYQHQPQYLDDAIIRPTCSEVFVDCGAYIGDTIMDWRAYLRDHGIENMGKVYAWEPDEKNMQRMKDNLKDVQDIEYIQKGTWNEKGTLKFLSGENTQSGASENGNVVIEVDSIDNIVKDDKVTFIKIDVEGAEMKALEGARETIRKYKPSCAICVYHKRNDLIDVYEYMKKLVPEYKFYLRNYSWNGTETVLYCVV